MISTSIPAAICSSDRRPEAAGEPAYRWWVRKVHKERQELRAQQAHKDRKVRQELQVPRVRKAQPVQQALQARRGRQARWGQLAHKVRQAQRG